MVLTILAILAIVVAPRFIGLKESALKVKREEVIKTIESTINHGHQLYLLQQTNPPTMEEFKAILRTTGKKKNFKEPFYKKQLLNKTLLFGNKLITIRRGYPSIFRQIKRDKELQLIGKMYSDKIWSNNLLAMLEITNTLTESSSFTFTKSQKFKYLGTKFLIRKDKKIYTGATLKAKRIKMNDPQPPFVLLIALSQNCAIGIVQESSKKIKKPKVIPLGDCKS